MPTESPAFPAAISSGVSWDVLTSSQLLAPSYEAAVKHAKATLGITRPSGILFRV